MTQPIELIPQVYATDFSDTVPRNLHLLGGKVRASAMREGTIYVARNGRIKSPQIVTYAATLATRGRHPARAVAWAGLHVDIRPALESDAAYRRRLAKRLREFADAVVVGGVG